MSKSRIVKTINSVLSSFFVVQIRFYQAFISPLLPQCCRFSPTCSQYGVEAFKKHGPFKGFLLTFFRFMRCNPYFSGGDDPVPEELNWSFKSIKQFKTRKYSKWTKIH